MRNGLYHKLAFTNLKNNKLFYVPYLLACIGTSMMFNIMMTLFRDPVLDTMSGGPDVKMVLQFGCIVIAIFSAIILFYTNSVLTKHRKKEFGLYNILGMEKRHIGIVLFWETIYTAIITFVAGEICSLVFSKLLKLVLARIIDVKIEFGMNFDSMSLVATVIIFSIIFVLLYLKSLVIVKKSKPVELLHGSNQGEKEPKSNWFLAVLGVICLGAGYVIAATTSDAVTAILMFFIAVLLVIAGTYLLFTAFSIVLLKSLRKNKKFYYKTSHFATVSGMLYRMKRNAAGLASICILSTMVLVTISTTVCLYAGADSIANSQCDKDIAFYTSSVISNELKESVSTKALEITKDCGLKSSDYNAYDSLNVTTVREGNNFVLEKENNKVDTSRICAVWMTTVDGYKALSKNNSNKNVTLNDGEALCYTDGDPLSDTITVFGKEFKNRPFNLDDFEYRSSYSMIGYKTLYLIVKDNDVLQELFKTQSDFFDGKSSQILYTMSYNLDGSNQEKIDCKDKISKATADVLKDTGVVYEVKSKNETRTTVRSFYGAFFFLGMFLGLVFAAATVLIIYYKQISEGFDDQQRFNIMEKVGMTNREVKKTIHSQILIVFFLPILAAAAHIVFAFPMIKEILTAFGMSNTGLFIGCILVTLAVFAVLYTIVYMITARSYYKIVSKH